MISVLLSRLVLLFFGTLYPAYASYKTVKTKNVKECVRWMMYWIVFALYTCIEIFSDIFIAFWFPFYYELKIVFVFWLVCPATRGSSYIFRKVVNPHLSRHEKKLDEHISSLCDHGYDLVRKIGIRGVDYLGHFVVDLLHKGQLTAAEFIPNLKEVAQDHSVVDSSNSNAPPNTMDAIDDETFDILMVENTDLYNDAHNINSQSSSGVIEESDSSSISEDFNSVKKRPLRVAAKKKAKASGTRERKKKSAN